MILLKRLADLLNVETNGFPRFEHITYGDDGECVGEYVEVSMPNCRMTEWVTECYLNLEGTIVTVRKVMKNDFEVPRKQTLDIADPKFFEKLAKIIGY